MRSEFSLSSAVDRLEANYTEAVGGNALAEEPRPSEFAVYLEKLSHDADLMWEELQRMRRRVSADAPRLAAGNVTADAIAAAPRPITLAQTS